jgi:hypothetical protein
VRTCGWLPLIVLGVALAPAAQAEIYKCTDEHGNVAYLQTPCPPEVVTEPVTTDDAEDPAAEVEASEDIAEPLPVPQADEALEVCRKRYRDQIDAIDAELRASFSPEQAAAYKEKLLALTRQLRACG